MEWKPEPVWDSMVRDHGNPFEKEVDKPEKDTVESVKRQRQQPKRQPRRKR